VLHLPTAYIADGDRPGYGEPAAGDHLQATYRFWLAAHQVAHGREPWLDPYSFQPIVEPQTVLMGWPWSLPYWPLHLAFGPLIAWNLLLLATIVAAGLVTFAWLRTLALPPPAAFLGGVAFAIAPYRLGQSGAGHLLGWLAILIPLALFAYERSRRAATPRAAGLWGALAALSVLSIPLSGQVHLALGALPFCLAYAAIRFRPGPFAWMAGGVLVGMAAGLLVRETIIAGSIAAEGRSLAQVELFQSNWLDLLSRLRRRGLEPFAYVGWLLPLAALAGIVLLARRRQRWLAALLAVSVVLPLLIALGTNFPAYEALRDLIPPFRFPRVPGRLIPVANLALAAAAAVAVAHLLSLVSPRRRLAAGTVAVAFCLADLLVLPFGTGERGEPDLARAALRGAPAGRVLDLPYLTPGSHLGAVYDIESIAAPGERLSGYSSLAPREAYRLVPVFRRLNCGAWLPGDTELLEQLGVRHVVFHGGVAVQTRVPGWWFAWHGLQEAGYRTATPQGPTWLFERGPGAERAPPFREPPRARAALCDGWSRTATREPQAALWLYGEGTAILELLADVSGRTRIHVDGALADEVRLGARRRVELPLVGQRWHAVVLETPALASRPGVIWLLRASVGPP
jgi:hypothetical protein